MRRRRLVSHVELVVSAIGVVALLVLLAGVGVMVGTDGRDDSLGSPIALGVVGALAAAAGVLVAGAGRGRSHGLAEALDLVATLERASADGMPSLTDELLQRGRATRNDLLHSGDVRLVERLDRSLLVAGPGSDR